MMVVLAQEVTPEAPQLLLHPRVGALNPNRQILNPEP